jgi:glycosyltransferase involved in cell wall biosynthesis
MAAGVATITSHMSALPEVAGDPAELIGPLSAAELAAALVKLLIYSGLRAKLAVAGRNRAEEFRWDRCACQTMQYLQYFRGYGPPLILVPVQALNCWTVENVCSTLGQKV